MYLLYIIKRWIEDVVMFPFIILGKLIAMIKPLDKEYDTFFFFPFYNIGGAEKVHSQIVQALGNEKCIIYFTRKSRNAQFYDEFAASGCVMKDISRYTDNKFLYPFNLIYRGIISYHINRQKKKPIVFNGQCNFAYKLSPWVKKNIRQIELIHSFNSFSWIRLPFLPFFHQTIMISRVAINDHLEQYKKLGVPEKYSERIRYIGNGIKIEGNPPPKTPGRLQALYVGRGTPEKRVHIVAKIAEANRQKDKETTFLLVGDADKTIPAALHQYCIFHPYESDENKIRAIYDQSDILMITSNTEGFPMVVMEAMARGCAIIATPVGDLPVHIKNGVNGFLITTVHNEAQVVSEAVEYIQRLRSDPTLRQQIAGNNIKYAGENFSIATFQRNYAELFKSMA